MARPAILVTGATGRLGGLVIDELLKAAPAASVAAIVRRSADGSESPAAKRLASLGVQTREADYTDPASLDGAFADVERLLFISSNAREGRVVQHANVVEAARRAGVGLVAYTSLLHAGTSPLAVAGPHRETEVLLRESGTPHVLLRNGWYTENYLATVPAAVKRQAYQGAAGDGRIASAARADYAAAGAAVLTTSQDLSGRVFELAGDQPYTLRDLAAEVSRASGRPVAYNDLSPADFLAALMEAGFPSPVADLFVDTDIGAKGGALFDDSRDLSRLIGRPTTPMVDSIARALDQS